MADFFGRSFVPKGRKAQISYVSAYVNNGTDTVIPSTCDISRTGNIIPNDPDHNYMIGIERIKFNLSTLPFYIFNMTDTSKPDSTNLALRMSFRGVTVIQNLVFVQNDSDTSIPNISTGVITDFDQILNHDGYYVKTLHHFLNILNKAADTCAKSLYNATGALGKNPLGWIVHGAYYAGNVPMFIIRNNSIVCCSRSNFYDYLTTFDIYGPIEFYFSTDLVKLLPGLMYSDGVTADQGLYFKRLFFGSNGNIHQQTETSTPTFGSPIQYNFGQRMSVNYYMALYFQPNFKLGVFNCIKKIRIKAFLPVSSVRITKPVTWPVDSLTNSVEELLDKIILEIPFDPKWMSIEGRSVVDYVPHNIMWHGINNECNIKTITFRFYWVDNFENEHEIILKSGNFIDALLQINPVSSNKIPQYLGITKINKDLRNTMSGEATKFLLNHMNFEKLSPLDYFGRSFISDVLEERKVHAVSVYSAKICTAQIPFFIPEFKNSLTNCTTTIYKMHMKYSLVAEKMYTQEFIWYPTTSMTTVSRPTVTADPYEHDWFYAKSLTEVIYFLNKNMSACLTGMIATTGGVGNPMYGGAGIVSTAHGRIPSFMWNEKTKQIEFTAANYFYDNKTTATVSGGVRNGLADGPVKLYFNKPLAKLLAGFKFVLDGLVVGGHSDTWYKLDFYQTPDINDKYINGTSITDLGNFDLFSTSNCSQFARNLNTDLNVFNPCTKIIVTTNLNIIGQIQQDNKEEFILDEIPYYFDEKEYLVYHPSNLRQNIIKQKYLSEINVKFWWVDKSGSKHLMNFEPGNGFDLALMIN